ncbi:MAG: glucans biosynthesis glucosyltransferase MdoH [Roseobacter sp.]
MTPATSHAFAVMPDRAPLEMHAQQLARTPQNTQAHPAVQDKALPWRLAVFVPAIIGTAVLIYGMFGWLAETGMTALEWALLTLIGLTFVWVAFSVSTIGVALAGIRSRSLSATPVTDARPIDVALLVPIYNEPTSDVFGNAAAMLDDLDRGTSNHRYSLFILSDTNDPEIAAREERAFAHLHAASNARTPIFYRRRQKNTDKKVGNLLDWITGWGAKYEAMVVLDADSLMTGRAIDHLACAMSVDDQAGLIQTCPVLIGAESVFARVQQFSNVAYGWLLAEGLANWARGEGNYWGHNAIIRTRAFASSAGLPHLMGRRGQDELILSHDFVEAGLLRRAGWRVRFMPRLSGSFEETPSTLIDYVLRDQRWCRGNLQHLRLLGTAGLHPVSRFHLLHGAVSYLVSPAWFVLLVVWFLLGKDSETNVIRYFNEANPLFPDWPPAMSHIDSAIFLLIMYAMLLTPKLMGALIIGLHPKASRLYGGRGAFFAAFGTEVVLSIAYAPVLMVQQTKAVFRALIGRPVQWGAQRRGAARYPFAALLRFHWMETGLGVILTFGLASGLVSWWLSPIAFSLLLAVPLSALSAQTLGRWVPAGLRMQSPHTLREPAIFTRARDQRLAMDKVLSAPQIPAE